MRPMEPLPVNRSCRCRYAVVRTLTTAVIAASCPGGVMQYLPGDVCDAVSRRDRHAFTSARPDEMSRPRRRRKKSDEPSSLIGLVGRQALGRRRGCVTSRAGRSHKPNTYSMDAVEVNLSSGEFVMTAPGCLEPTRTATNCLPLIE